MLIVYPLYAMCKRRKINDIYLAAASMISFILSNVVDLTGEATGETVSKNV